jgi:hypothetical protein
VENLGCVRRLHTLKLQGSAAPALLHQLLIFARTSSAMQKALNLMTLVLIGINLLSVDWMPLFRMPHSACPEFRHNFNSRRPRDGGHQHGMHTPQGDHVQDIQCLHLIDCSHHGQLLPYLCNFPRLSELRMVSSGKEDPIAEEVGSNSSSVNATPDFSFGSSSPALQFSHPLHSSSHSHARETISSADFLCLADCPELETIRCDYDIRLREGQTREGVWQQLEALDHRMDMSSKGGE